MFALTELVDNPADVTFTSHADLDMGDDIEFVPGHGPMSTFGEERRSNPFVGE